MKKILHFRLEDIVPKGLEKSFTYSELDDSCLFKRQTLSACTVYRELITQIKKNIDPNCRFLSKEQENDIAVSISADILFYLFTYFYCRFCYLSPYERPFVAMREIEEDEFHLEMQVKAEVYQIFPNIEQLLEKAKYLSKVCGFTVCKTDTDAGVKLSFCLKAEKSSKYVRFSVLAFSRVKRFVLCAISAAKNDRVK